LLYAILSDIHGNLHALEKVMQDIRSRNPDRIFCLGDLVGYGAFPEEIVAVAREQFHITLAGNHDHAAVGLTDISVFNPYAFQAALWTRQQLTPDAHDYLRNRPFTHKERNLLFAHSSPGQPEQWFYVFSDQEAEETMRSTRAGTAFIGHTHVPRDHSTAHGRLINVGSVGQPRDGDPRAAYTLFDDETGERKLIRIEYPIEDAQRAIRNAGLPAFLADRLAVGR